MNNSHLLKRLDDECELIELHANIYFAQDLLGEQHGEMSAHIRRHFNRPFHDIANVVLRPKGHIMTRVNKLKRILSGKSRKDKWLSIQARAMFSHSPEQAFLCANSLLAGGQIKRVFLATDSEALQDLAYEMIDNSKDVLVTIEKTLQPDINDGGINHNRDNFEVRHSSEDAENAVLEWFLLGEADYCASVSLKVTASIIQVTYHL